MRGTTGMNLWVLVRRYEWESQSNETEYCDVYLFSTREDALRKAKTLLYSDMRKYASAGVEDYDSEANCLVSGLCDREFPRHMVELTDGDDVVFELYRRPLRGTTNTFKQLREDDYNDRP